MKPLAILLVFACILVGFLIGWVCRPAEPTNSPGVARRADTAFPEHDRSSLAQTAPSYSIREVAPASAAPEAQSPEPDLAPTVLDGVTVLDQALSAGASEPFSEEAMLRKYSGLSLDQLRLAELGIKQKARVEAQRIAKDMLERGDYEEQTIPDGERVKSPSPSADRPTVVWAGMAEPGNGFSNVKTMDIQPGKDSGFDNLLQERRWLDEYIYKLEHHL